VRCASIKNATPRQPGSIVLDHDEFEIEKYEFKMQVTDFFREEVDGVRLLTVY
jgi:hypothetical protein